MGYVRGVADEAIGRVIEAILSIPVILIGLLIISLLGASKPVVILTVAVLFTPIVARTVRTAVLSEAQLDYVEAAKLRGESGLYIMDGIEIESYGHLFDQFWSPLTNRRTDEYGGSLEHRLRFGWEVLQAIRERVGSDYIVGLRMEGSIG